jgi:lysophospholipase L1-like esterase
MTTNTSFRGILLVVASLVLATFSSTSFAQTQRSWEEQIKKFEETDLKNPPPKGSILFVGSSSIRLWPTDEYFRDKKIINRGFGGSQIEDSTKYADRIIIPYKPRMVVLYAGDNDLARGKTPEQVFADYKAFVERLRQDLGDVRIAFISVKPSIARWNIDGKIKAMNALVKTYTAQNKNLVYIDVYEKMLGDDGKPRASLYVTDGLHLTPEGYKLWTSIVKPYLK